MSHQSQENQGTGLRDVFDILVKAPSERLQSLTVQLGDSPEDSIIHALCLVVLQRKTQALNKLQILRDNDLANHLAEKLQISRDNSEDFGSCCDHPEELPGEMMLLLARIFKVLSEQRLCDPLLRDLAYQKALSNNSQNQKFDHLREEAKNVCGPQFAEWMCSVKDLKSGSCHDFRGGVDEENATLKSTVCQDQSETAHSLPSPLQAASSVPSYPSHLEMSLPPTASFQGDKRISETPDDCKPIASIHFVGEYETKNAPGQSSEEPQPKSNEPVPFEAKKKDTTMDATHTETPKQNTTQRTELKISLPNETNICQPKVPVPCEMHASKGAEEEEEAIFYAFVIMHAPEDLEMADNIREKLEAVIGSKGATFSDDFAIPGKSTLRCVEDAINSSAFTVLLLTRNFNTRMLEIKTNSALINSINNEHKYNTVIPLLPQKNCMSRQNIPIVLSTIVPLEENKNFERRVQKVMSPAKIKKFRNMWKEEQRVKIQLERQDTLKQFNEIQKQLLQEYKKVQVLDKEKLMLQQLLLDERQSGDGQARWPPNIHIENARYIMIGNDSQMTVDATGGADKDDKEQ